MVDSSTDSESGVGSKSESVVGSDFSLLASSVLGTLAGFDSTHSTTEECF